MVYYWTEARQHGIYLLIWRWRLRFGEDYHKKFEPKAYLNYYSGTGDQAEYREFSLRSFHEFWSKMAKRNVRVLDFGGGSAIFDLILKCCTICWRDYLCWVQRRKSERSSCLERKITWCSRLLAIFQFRSAKIGRQVHVYVLLIKFALAQLKSYFFLVSPEPKQTKVCKLVLANSSWYVWKAQKQWANKLANCWQQIELTSILANFFANLTRERLANMCW